jgi:hypothetical protein
MKSTECDEVIGFPSEWSSRLKTMKDLTSQQYIVRRRISLLKRALITGITGQDGAYLARSLLEKGYEVYGAYRRTTGRAFWRLEERRWGWEATQ